MRFDVGAEKTVGFFAFVIARHGCTVTVAPVWCGLFAATTANIINIRKVPACTKPYSGKFMSTRAY